jgi:hypothetical protein
MEWEKNILLGVKKVYLKDTKAQHDHTDFEAQFSFLGS